MLFLRQQRNGQKQAPYSLVAKLPIDRLLTESDAPSIHIAGRPVRPSDVGTVVDWLARLRQCHPAAIREAIASNLTRLESIGTTVHSAT
jgi:Tat protein secretion system quality control protein TatD with DNase activity